MVRDPIHQETGLATDLPSDRRRPGRQEDIANPSLISLLRGDVSDGLANWVEKPNLDPIAAVRGIVYAIPMAIILWVLIGLALWRCFDGGTYAARLGQPTDIRAWSESMAPSFTMQDQRTPPSSPKQQ